MSSNSEFVANIPEYVDFYTTTRIPADLTEEAIDEWLAIVPDLLDFWERELAKKKLEFERQEYATKQAVSLAYIQAPEGLAVKNKEHLANCDKNVIESMQKTMQLKYELNIVQAVYNKVESKSRAIHKIATLRVRRLEQGIISGSVYGKKQTESQVYRPKPVNSGRRDENGVVWRTKSSTENIVVKQSEKKQESIIDNDINNELNRESYKGKGVF